jgi:hypothetical protein
VRGLTCSANGKVHARKAGVSIGGVPWSIGQHCLYEEGAGGATKFGTVIGMYHGRTTDMDEFVVFKLERKPITSYVGHYCLLSNDGYTTVFVFWTQITWKCKELLLGPDLTLMALPFASCTSQELIKFR